MGVIVSLSRRRLMALTGASLALSACGRKPAAENVQAAGDAPAPAAKPAPAGSLEWAVAGDWRGADARRDAARHPLQTLQFFGLKPGMAVVEMWPGAGWYTQILAPYLAQTKGKLYAASFESAPGDSAAAEVVETYRQMFGEKKGLYGDIVFESFGPKSGPLAAPASADLVLFMLTLHSWMAAGLAEKAFHDAFAALKPGGVLGIEAHRAEMGEPQDPLASNGYVQEPYVKQMAQEAGFRFDQASDVNANPKDTKDHPFGVWTLPPERRSAPVGQPADPAFDHAPYDAIGESDRMTLRFIKPA
jgi:predicted methyltransferase